MNRTAFWVLLSYWQHNPFQLIILIAGLSMATALWTGVQAINVEARSGYERAADLAEYTALPSIQRTDGVPVTLDDFAQLRRAGVQVTPILKGEFTVNELDLKIFGIDFLSHPFAGWVLPQIEGVGQFEYTEAAVLLTGPKTAAAVQSHFADIQVQVIQGLPRDQVYGDIATVSRLLIDPIGLTSIELTKSQAPLPKAYQLVPAQAASDIRGLTDSFHLNLTAFGFLSFAIGLFIVHSGVSLAFEQRRPVFRTIRAIGMPQGNLLVLLFVELLLIALLSGLLGVVLGYVLASSLLPNVSATLRGLYGAASPSDLSVRPEWIFGGLSLSLIGAIAASGAAMWRLIKMPVLAPAMPRAWLRASTDFFSYLATLGIGLLILAACALFFGSGLVMAFVVLGGLLLGSAFVLPLCLSKGLRMAQRLSKGPEQMWFWADATLQLPGLSLALMALMLAMSANIGVNTMVSSFRTTFEEFLDQRLFSDYYVTPRTNEEADQIIRWMTPRAKHVLPIWNTNVTVNGHRAQMFGVVAAPVYQEKWTMLEGSSVSWKDVHADKGLLINEQLARKLDAKIGDQLNVEDRLMLPIAGIYADYGNTLGQIVVSNPQLLRFDPDVRKSRIGVILRDPNSDAMISALSESLNLNDDAIVKQSIVRDFSVSIFERTFSVTSTLNVLTLAVAGFALLTSLLTLSNLRYVQIAPVWAIGMATRRLAGFELLRAVVFASMTFLIAIPAGLSLAWVLLKVLNVEAFNWQLPMIFAPSEVIKLYLIAMMTAVLSACWPALKLSRQSAADLAKVFSVER